MNPNATEIAYDRIDQNCDGFDLADVDNDGYCKLGYVITNKTLQCNKETGNLGTDCEDNDSSYNIASTNKSKNCINDAPVINGIPRLIISEGDSAEIIVYASDPENDPLTYSVNDSRFAQENNILFGKQDMMMLESTCLSLCE